jgi:hypothetical protein
VSVESAGRPCNLWFGRYQPVPKSRAEHTYADNYLIDLKAAIIVDVEATRAIRQAEVGAARTMIETEDRLGLCPGRLGADSAYGSAECEGGSLTSTRSSRTFRCLTSRLATMGRSLAKTFPTIKNTTSTSPAGKVLSSTRTLVNDGATLLYRASKHDCDVLPENACPQGPAFNP